MLLPLRFSLGHARAVKAFNGEVSAGTGMTPLEYLNRHVEEGKSGKQPKDESVFEFVFGRPRCSGRALITKTH